MNSEEDLRRPDDSEILQSIDILVWSSKVGCSVGSVWQFAVAPLSLIGVQAVASTEIAASF